MRLKKCDSENKVSYHSRLVVNGIAQKSVIYLEETYSPAVRHCPLSLVIALSVKLDLKIICLHIKAAF